MQRENARALREERRKEEKLRRHGHVTSGQLLGSSGPTAGPSSDGIARSRQRQQMQFDCELQATEKLKIEKSVGTSTIFDCIFTFSKLQNFVFFRWTAQILLLNYCLFEVIFVAYFHEFY